MFENVFGQILDSFQFTIESLENRESKTTRALNGQKWPKAAPGGELEESASHQVQQRRHPEPAQKRSSDDDSKTNQAY